MLIIETVSYHWHCGTMAWPLKIALPLRRLQYKSVPTTEKSAGSYHINIKKYINNLHSNIQTSSNSSSLYLELSYKKIIH
jgi:hypothetical protein